MSISLTVLFRFLNLMGLCLLSLAVPALAIELRPVPTVIGGTLRPYFVLAVDGQKVVQRSTPAAGVRINSEIVIPQKDHWGTFYLTSRSEQLRVEVQSPGGDWEHFQVALPRVLDTREEQEGDVSFRLEGGVQTVLINNRALAFEDQRVKWKPPVPRRPRSFITLDLRGLLGKPGRLYNFLPEPE